MKFFITYFILAVIFWNLSCDSNTNKESEKNAAMPDSTAENQNQKKVSGDKESDKNEEYPKTPIEVTPIIRGEIASYLLYNSTLETEEMADVYSRIPGLIERIYVEEGARVSKNHRLVQIEQAEYVLEEEKASLQYDKQLSEFNRYEALQEKNLISVEEFETARLTLRQAELQLKQAKMNLDFTIVRSPINGVIGERFIRLGDRIQTSTRLFVVSNPREKVAKLFVPQDEMPKCYINQTASITTDVLPENNFQGWVKRISPMVDPTSGTFKVTAGVKDPENLLRPGMFVGIKLIVDIREDTRLIPKAALIYENERTYFFIVKNDSAHRLELKKGFEDSEKVEVLNLIADSLKVIVVGQGGLRDGHEIRVVKEKYYPWQEKVLDKITSSDTLLSKN